MSLELKTGQRGGSVHKDGVYLVRIIKAEQKRSQAGNDMVSLQLAVLRNGNPFGPLIYDHIVLTESSEWRLLQLMDALDAPENTVVPISWLVGQNVYVRIASEEFNDDTRSKVTRYMLPSVAQKLVANSGENGENGGSAGDDSFLGVSEPGAKARGRGRPARAAQPAELNEDDSLPF